MFELDGESDEAAAISERTWTLTYEAADGATPPQQFTFPEGSADAAEMVYLRYDDADMVTASATVDLAGDYGDGGKSWVATAIIGAVLLLMAVGFILFRGGPQTPGAASAGRYSVPEEITPFTVISLLRRIRDENDLQADTHSQLAESIDSLEQHYFGPGSGDEPNLKAVAEEWVRKAA